MPPTRAPDEVLTSSMSPVSAMPAASGPQSDPAGSGSAGAVPDQTHQAADGDRVAALDPVGAGDAFAVALLAELTQGTGDQERAGVDGCPTSSADLGCQAALGRHNRLGPSNGFTDRKEHDVPRPAPQIHPVRRPARNRAHRIGLGASALLVVAACTACSGSDSDGASPTVPETSTKSRTLQAPVPGGDVRPDDPDTSSPGDGSNKECRASDLAASVEPAGHAAGAAIVRLVLTKTSPGLCQTGGYGGASYVAGPDGDQMGAPAERVRSGELTPIGLGQGGEIAAELELLDVANYPVGDCRPAPVDGLRVYPPNETESLFVPIEGDGCRERGVTQLKISPYRTR